MSDLFLLSVPVGIMLVVLFFTLGLIILVKRVQRRNRRNPLTKDLLRNPGETLREQESELHLDLVGYVLLLVFIPLVLYSQVVTEGFLRQRELTFASVIPSVIVGVVAIVYLFFRLVALLRKRTAVCLGFECETAVGQELNQLMLCGCRVYHDFPAEGFNIDHIVIGPAGVYAVETKGRAKPDKGRGVEDARVVYDGKKLQFPGWSETEPIVQAKRQAQWLASWLNSAVGESVPVQPALALPGWYIERKGRDMVVFNSKNPGFLATPRGERVLSGEMIQRVAYQVEQRCRTVEPLSYRKRKIMN